MPKVCEKCNCFGHSYCKPVEAQQQVWQKKDPVIGEVQLTAQSSEGEVQSEVREADIMKNGNEPEVVLVDKGKEVLIEDPMSVIPPKGTGTPSPQGAPSPQGFTLVVNKKNKVWIGSSSSSQGQKNQLGKLAAGLVNGRLGARIASPLPPSPPKGRGRGEKRGKGRS
ncbi:unnamed protein product [Linum trigynum]|uniref:Uncharacterized protein n=1 Tax=Linum trigynum TaxID=586398 RepID=A0AAV2CSB3_9ROSI